MQSLDDLEVFDEENSPPSSSTSIAALDSCKSTSACQKFTWGKFSGADQISYHNSGSECTDTNQVMKWDTRKARGPKKVEWKHITVVYAGTEKILRMYVDGIIIGCRKSGATTFSAAGCQNVDHSGQSVNQTDKKRSGPVKMCTGDFYQTGIF